MGNFKVEMLALRRMETWWGCRYHFEERARWCNNVLCDNIPLGLRAVTLKMPLLNSLKCCLHSSYCSLIVAQTVTFYKWYNCETNFMLILWILPLYHNPRAENTFTIMFLLVYKLAPWKWDLFDLPVLMWVEV